LVLMVVLSQDKAELGTVPIGAGGDW
jgi:hypothetical protein